MLQKKCLYANGISHWEGSLLVAVSCIIAYPCAELHYCQAHNKAPSLCTGIADYAKPANETSAAEYICTSVCIYIYLKLGNSMQLKQVIALIDKISNNCGGFTVFGLLFFQCCHIHTPKPMPFLHFSLVNSVVQD